MEAVIKQELATADRKACDPLFSKAYCDRCAPVRPAKASRTCKTICEAGVVQSLVSAAVAARPLVSLAGEAAALLQQWAQVPCSWVVLGALPPCS